MGHSAMGIQLYSYGCTVTSKRITVGRVQYLICKCPELNVFRLGSKNIKVEENHNEPSCQLVGVNYLISSTAAECNWRVNLWQSRPNR